MSEPHAECCAGRVCVLEGFPENCSCSCHRQGRAASEPTAEQTRPERPLHVRVAEALESGLDIRIGYPQNIQTIQEGGSLPAPGGAPLPVWYIVWTPKSGDGHDCVYQMEGEPCECRPQWNRVPRYDTDWSATGPLIERLGIQIMNLELKVMPTMWSAALSSDHNWALGQTPLVAVCALILALAAAGKLERPRP